MLDLLKEIIYILHRGLVRMGISPTKIRGFGRGVLAGGFVREFLSNTLLIVSLLTMTFCFVCVTSLELLFILFLRVGYGQVKRRVGRLGSGQASYGTFRASIRVNLIISHLIIAVVGPSIWNGLPLSISSLPRTLYQTFLST